MKLTLFCLTTIIAFSLVCASLLIATSTLILLTAFIFYIAKQFSKAKINTREQLIKAAIAAKHRIDQNIQSSDEIEDYTALSWFPVYILYFTYDAKCNWLQKVKCLISCELFIIVMQLLDCRLLSKPLCSLMQAFLNQIRSTKHRRSDIFKRHYRHINMLKTIKHGILQYLTILNRHIKQNSTSRLLYKASAAPVKLQRTY